VIVGEEGRGPSRSSRLISVAARVSERQPKARRWRKTGSARRPRGASRPGRSPVASRRREGSNVIASPLERIFCSAAVLANATTREPCPCAKEIVAARARRRGRRRRDVDDEVGAVTGHVDVRHRRRHHDHPTSGHAEDTDDLVTRATTRRDERRAALDARRSWAMRRWVRFRPAVVAVVDRRRSTGCCASVAWRVRHVQHVHRRQETVDRASRLRRHSGDQSARRARCVSLFVAEVRERKRPDRTRRCGRARRPDRSSNCQRPRANRPGQSDAKFEDSRTSANVRIALVQDATTCGPPHLRARRHESDLLSAFSRIRAPLLPKCKTRRGPVPHPLMLSP